MPQLLWRSCDKGEWTWASPQWLKHTGQTQEESLGQGWLDAVHPDDHAATREAWAGARSHGELDVEFRVRCAANGTYRWHRTRSAPARSATGQILEWLGSTADIEKLKQLQAHQRSLLGQMAQHAEELEAEIRERRRVEARLLHGARHDHLTQLPNRAYLLERLTEALDRQGGAGCSILFLDLDHFKLVNDSLGHAVGDQMLVEVARRLTDCLGPHDTLARFGGDEFALLVHDAEAAMALVDCISRIMREPLWLQQQEILSSCSIGVVHAVGSAMRPEEMLRNADIAMYHAKRLQGGGHAVFTETMRLDAVEALELRNDLSHALARDEFRLHYQPICAAGNRTIVGLEALLRWRHPRRGLVLPYVFIGLAEELGLIRHIGRWVLRQACAQISAWRAEFPALDIRLNVNSSGEELKQSCFLAEARDALRAAGLAARVLQIEITESVFLQEPERVGTILDGLRKLGIRIALDDFGTGYSSLSYLDHYKVDTIKIDRSFIARMTTHQGSSAIVRAIVGLGRAMDLEVVAEGVETESQLHALRACGCGMVQGYHLGRPAAAEDIALRLAQQVEQGTAGLL